MRTRATITALTAAALLALTACSSSDDTDNKPGDAQSTAQSPKAAGKADDGTTALKKSVEDYTAALFSGDTSGYDLMSARCQKQMPEAEWAAMAKQAHQQYGSQKATGVKVDQLAGDLARVSYGAGQIPQFEREGQPWTREGGTWRWDACPSTS